MRSGPGHAPSISIAGGMSLLVSALLAVLPVTVTHGETDRPTLIGLIMDDLGNRPLEGRRVAKLPGPVACSVLPHTPYAADLASRCHRMGKVVMLHLPM